MKKALIATAALACFSERGPPAELEKGFITAFRHRVQTCSRLPADVDVTGKVRVVVRISAGPAFRPIERS